MWWWVIPRRVRPRCVVVVTSGQAVRWWQEAEELGGAAVAEHGAGSAGQDGRQPAAVLREGGVADGVDALVEAVQAAGPQPVLDRIGGEPEREELFAGDDPVLTAGQPGDRRVDCDFWALHARKSHHGPMVAPKR